MMYELGEARISCVYVHVMRPRILYGQINTKVGPIVSLETTAIYVWTLFVVPLLQDSFSTTVC